MNDLKAKTIIPEVNLSPAEFHPLSSTSCFMYSRDRAKDPRSSSNSLLDSAKSQVTPLARKQEGNSIVSKHKDTFSTALTFAEINTSPQVVEECLPNFHIIRRLNKTCNQRLFKNICGEDKDMGSRFSVTGTKAWDFGHV